MPEMMNISLNYQGDIKPIGITCITRNKTFYKHIHFTYKIEECH